MSITILEQKLYKSNFKSEEARFNILFSLHAYLSKHKEVPSFYIQQNNLNVFNLIDKVLFSDISNLIELNSENIKSLGMPKKFFSSLSYEETDEILEMIEDIICNGLGKGFIHYEKLRIYPEENCLLLKILTSEKNNNLQYEHLIRILEKRLFEAKKYLSQINANFTEGERNYHPSIISKSYSLLFEKSWKNSWMSNSNYMTDLTSNILILEDV